MPYVDRIMGFGKENLLDILHYLALEIEEKTGLSEIRIYLEEMHGGTLNCLYTPEGELERKGALVPIHRRDNYLVKAYLETQFIGNVPLSPEGDTIHSAWISTRGLTRSAVFPLFSDGVSIGVMALDAPDGTGDVVSSGQRESVRNILSAIMPVLARAHSFHQQIMTGRHLDKSRKTEVARMFLDGALKLDLALDMTSVLIPAGSPVPVALRRAGGGYMEILASASRNPADLSVYETLERISLLEGESLLARLVMQDGEKVLRRPGSPDSIFFEDILAESFDRWDVFKELSLRTLLMVPVVGDDGQVMCVVNYFTRRPHSYTESEVNLLTSHARNMGLTIEDTGGEHFEIRVLSEIEELMSADTSLERLLGKVVSLAVELLGADSGSIALVRESGEERWLVVEERDDGGPVGAKSRGWRKAQIPDLKVGGEELPPEERSLTGYVAHTGKPFLCRDTAREGKGSGFYRPLSPQVLSELAVPVMVGSTVIGVFNLDSHTRGYFTAEYQRMLVLISRLIAGKIADQMKITELTAKVSRLKKEVSYKDPEVSSYLLGNIIGKSEPSRNLVERMGRLSVPLTNRLVNWSLGRELGMELGLPTILVTGETGAGKEFVFNNLYSLLNERFREQTGSAKELPVRKTNIAAFSGELTYTELFGHRKGAYTGAHADRQGILEEADGGVVFLDEIGDADLKTQVQLLRFLDGGEFSRLGESRTRQSRVIFVAATNRDLVAEIEGGAFREDLYHRLREIVLSVPSLRQRREDIPDLSRHFIGRLHASYSGEGTAPRLNEEATTLLSGLDYPGNIRELMTILQGAMFESQGQVIGREEVLRSLAHIRDREPPAGDDDPAALYGLMRQGEASFWEMVHAPFLAREMTRDTVLAVFDMARAEGGGVREAARLLGALGDDDQNGRNYTRFRNFIYKTVGVTKS
jgi:transcriptional regulator with GAF, ATPase, and Fis domain